MRHVRVLLPFAILCMSLAPSQADRARSAKFACWRPPGRCWLWRWQAAAYHLPSPAQPPPRPSHLPRRSIFSSAAAVAPRARSRRSWARHAVAARLRARALVAWKDQQAGSGNVTLESLSGRPVRLRFTLAGAGSQLWSFRLSESPCGQSHGYVAGGGPGFDGATDERGSCA